MQRVLVSLGLVASAAVSASAALVDISGDLGSQFLTSSVNSSNLNTSTTTTFTQGNAFGVLSGDVVATNTAGTNLSLKITNLNMTVVTPVNAFAQPFFDVLVVAQHDFTLSAFLNFNVQHTLAGTWSTAVGNGITLDSIADSLAVSSVAVPQIGGINTGGATSFSYGPQSASGVCLSPVFRIATSLRIHLDTSMTPWTVTLPTSADVEVTLVPAPGTIGILAFAGVVGSRRRR
jgi:hypothetical protein